MEKTVCKTSFWSLLKGQLNNLNSEEFADKIAVAPEGEFLLIDVRSPEEFNQGSFPDARNINYSSGDLWDQLEMLNKEKDIFVFCRSGRRSIRVCTLLRNGGFDKDKVFNLDGGLNSFSKYYDFELNRL
ncbi:MAG: rhodanese-like domain-containing protein [Bacteroidetes bacterium]|nr:MAG: rhodanese-like domain-containing protein [Bacteroidota bacterium]